MATLTAVVSSNPLNNSAENPMGIVDLVTANYAISCQNGFYYVLQRCRKFWDVISTPFHTYEEAMDFAFDLVGGGV